MKSLLIGVFVLIIGATSYGQPNKFDMGIEGSASLIFLRGNDFIEEHYQPDIGFSGGLFFQYNFKKILSLRTNVAGERKGAMYKNQLTNSNGQHIGEETIHVKFGYLTVPVLVRASFGKKVQFFVNAGPYFGFLIRQIYENQEYNIIADYTEDNKRFDTGISSGIGIIVPIKTKFAFSFEARNNIGLYNVSDPLSIVRNPGPIKTNSTNFLFGFTYKLGQRTTESK